MHVYYISLIWEIESFLLFIIFQVSQGERVSYQKVREGKQF